MWQALAGAGLGLVKGGQEKQQEWQDRMLAAETQRYSPWTKLQAQPVQRAPGGIARGIEGALGGAQMMQNAGMQDAQQNYYKALAERMARQNAAV